MRKRALARLSGCEAVPNGPSDDSDPTAAARAIVSATLERYGFSRDAIVTLVNVSENVTYRVDDPSYGCSAAIRIHRPDYHSRAAIESELAWLDSLRKSGVIEPPRPLTALDGSRVITVRVSSDAIQRHVVLFEWLGGQQPDTDSDLKSKFRILGGLAAKIHLHGSEWNPPASFTRYTCDYDAGLGHRAMWGRWQNGLGLGSSERAILSRTDEEIRARLDEYGTGPDCFGLCHNDLRLANLLIDGDHIRVIDFDDCGYSWYMYDFATAVSFIEDHPGVGDWLSAWVGGYQAHRALSSVNFLLIPTLVMFRRLILVGWVGSHHTYAPEAAALGSAFTSATCDLAESYLAGRFLR